MKLKWLLFFLVLLFSVYQDFPLVNYLGEIAKSPIVLLVPFLVLYIFSERKMPISEYTKVYLVYLLYLIGISVVYTSYLIIKNKSFYVFDENLIIKNIKMISYPICSFIFYQFIYVFLKRNNDLRRLLKAVLAVQFLLIIILIFEAQVYKTKELFLPYLHSNLEKYWRVRLLTFESSWSGSVVVIFSFLPLFLVEYLNISKLKKIIIYSTSIFFFLYYTMHSESKGYLFLVLVSLLPMLLNYMYKNKKLRIVLFAALIPIAITFTLAYSVLKEDVLSQLNTSITFGTRITGYLSSLKTFVYNPLGIGLGPYVEIYTNSINSIVATDFMQDFNLLEVKQYLSSPKFLSSKTYFFDHLVFGGLAFLLFFYLFFIKRLNKIKKVKNTYLLRMILIYVVLAAIFYLTFHIKYEIWFFLAFVDYFENYEKGEA